MTGEVIRQMSVLNRKGGNANAVAASAAALAYQQQLQMQATYERVLKVKAIHNGALSTQEWHFGRF